MTGFDAVIGNPPYVAKRKITDYTYQGFDTDNCPDIYAPCMERAATLVKPQGGYAMIVPLSFQYSNRYAAARKMLATRVHARWVSSYGIKPSTLFDTAISVRSVIVIGRTATEPLLAVTELRRWPSGYRPYLFHTNQYATITLAGNGAVWPRLGYPQVKALYDALTVNDKAIADGVVKTGPAVWHKSYATYSLSVFIDPPPTWTPNGKRLRQRERGLSFRSAEVRDVAFMLLSGRMAYWWWTMNGNELDLTQTILTTFPIAPAEVSAVAQPLRDLAQRLRDEQSLHPSVVLNAGKLVGNYDMLRCRHITDEAEKLILDTLGLSHLWPAVLLADARSQKATREGHGVKREWPFPW